MRRSLVNGAYSIAYFKHPSDPRCANDPAMKAYKSELGQYCSSCEAGDAFNTFGVLVADTMVKTLIKAGKTPTRAKLVKAADNLKLTNPLLYKGVEIRDIRPLP